MDANKFAAALGKEAKMPITAGRLKSTRPGMPAGAGMPKPQPSALRGNLGDIFQGPTGRGLLPPSPATAKPGVPKVPMAAPAAYKMGDAPAVPPLTNTPTQVPRAMRSNRPVLGGVSVRGVHAVNVDTLGKSPTTTMDPLHNQYQDNQIATQRRMMNRLYPGGPAPAIPLPGAGSFAPGALPALGKQSAAPISTLPPAPAPKMTPPAGPTPPANPFAPQGGPVQPNIPAPQPPQPAAPQAPAGGISPPPPAPELMQPVHPTNQHSLQGLFDRDQQAAQAAAAPRQAYNAAIGTPTPESRARLQAARAPKPYMPQGVAGPNPFLPSPPPPAQPSAGLAKQGMAPMPISPGVHTPTAPQPVPMPFKPSATAGNVPMPKIEAPVVPPSPSTSVAAGPVNTNSPGMLDSVPGNEGWMSRIGALGSHLGGAAIPGAIGAGIGGLYGALFPGEDEEGEQNSRLGSGLTGAAMGGAVGAGLGATGIPQRAMGDLMPKMARAEPDTEKKPAAKEAPVKKTEAPGPYDAQAGAASVGAGHLLKAIEYNRRNSPWHYWLNPMINGPVDGMREKSVQRGAAAAGTSWGGLAGVAAGGVLGGVAGGVGGEALGSGLGDTFSDLGSTLGTMGTSHALGTDNVVKRVADRHSEHVAPFKAAAVGPYDAHLAANVGNYDELIASAEYNKANHPGHYWLNPALNGPLGNLLMRYGRRVDAGMHKSWPMTLAALPTLGVAPAIAGGDEAQNAARGTLKQMETEMASEDAAAAAPNEAKKVAAFIGEIFAEKCAASPLDYIRQQHSRVRTDLQSKVQQLPPGQTTGTFTQGKLQPAAAPVLPTTAPAAPKLQSQSWTSPRAGEFLGKPAVSAPAPKIKSESFTSPDAGSFLGKASEFARKLGTSLNPMFEGDEKRPEMRLQRSQIKPWREDGNAAFDGIAKRFEYKKQKKAAAPIALDANAGGNPAAPTLSNMHALTAAPISGLAAGAASLMRPTPVSLPSPTGGRFHDTYSPGQRMVNKAIRDPVGAMVGGAQAVGSAIGNPGRLMQELGRDLPGGSGRPMPAVSATGGGGYGAPSN